MSRSNGLAVARLDGLLAAAWRHRLTLVVAPAGSGKSTLLARFASSSPAPVAWYRAESWDREPARMLHHLESALAGAADGLRGGWETIEDAVGELRARPASPCLLIVDDLHTLESTAAEAALERLIRSAPAWLTVIAASRVPPDFNLPRMRVSGELLEIGSDDLRFRSWEVEQLFRDFYGERLPPEEIAFLARRTEGWAAGLQLFHLATRGKPPHDRRRVLDGLGTGSRLTRDYLARNVLHDLPGALRGFLVETSVLGRLTGPLCDRLLDRAGSAGVLDELEGRCLFTFALPEPGAYRYHEVFRSHLLGVLLESHGEEEARHRHEIAGHLLAGASAIPEALDAFCRAGAWEEVDRLLGRGGAAVSDRAERWMDAVPPALLRHDPWLMLASARSLRAQGRLVDAVDAYGRAEAGFGDSEAAQSTRRERRSLQQWLQPDGVVAADPWGLLRAATRRDPSAVRREAAQMDGPAAALVAGLAALLDGRVVEADRALTAVAGMPESGGLVAIFASLGAGAAALLAGDQHGAIEIEGAVVAAEDAGLEWLARVGRACLALADPSADLGTVPGSAVRETEVVADGCASSGDAWGAALADLLVGWAAGDPVARVARLGAAGAAFRRLGAPVLEAWALGLGALAQVDAGDPGAETAALQAEAMARTTGSAAARYFGYQALAASRTDGGVEYEALLANMRDETGIRLPHWARSEESPLEGVPSLAGRATILVSSPPVRMRCFGSLELTIAGRDVGLASLRPRVRSLLRLLCAHVGDQVHEEVIQEAFWPEADPATGARNLHVAISALRRVVEPDAARGRFQVVIRDGASYRLAIGADSEIDLIRFDELVAKASSRGGAGDPGVAERAYAQALALYRGELLADEGPATWLVEPREQRRRDATEAAQWLATARLARGEYDSAARTCAAGLRIDRYHDPLWRTLIEARDLAGDRGTAQRARDGYAAVLAELGVSAAER